MTIKYEGNTGNISEYVTRPDKEIRNDAYKLCVKGDALRFANRFQEAIPKYLRSAFIDRNNPDTYIGLALSYKHSGNFDKALVYLKKALNIAPDNVKALRESGIIFLQIEKPCCAVKSFIQAVHIEPENYELQILLAQAHEEMEEYDLALSIYDKIIDDSPKYFRAYSHKAALLMSLEDYVYAGKVFLSITKLNPKFHKAYLGAAMCFEKLRRTHGAIRYYSKFLKIKPNSHEADEIRIKLRKLKGESPEKNQTIKIVKF